MAERRLAAILFTDIVGYTALMAESEERGLAARNGHRALVAPLVERYGGQWLGSRGDDSLSIFPAALDAVNCALAILDGARAAGSRLHVGIHLGDVVVEEGEISGDGVNIAARLCALSDGEGAFVSGELYQAVRNQPNVTASALGPRELKNVLRPVEVYVLHGPPGAPGVRGEARHRRLTRRGWRFAAVAVVLTLAAVWVARAVILGFLLDRLGLGGLPAELPLPDGPSVVVLRFANLDADPGRDYFAEGITEDLTTDLSGIPELFVVSRNSAFAYRNREVEVRAVGKALGVRYVVQGSVRREGDRVRVTAELTDATTGFQLWSKRYDRVLSDLFALQSEISEEILAALNVALEEAELNRIRHKPTGSLTAYDAVKRANAEFYRFRRDGNARARDLYHRAIEIDPGYAQAYALLANTYNYEYMGGWNQDESHVDRAEHLVRRALEIDPLSPEAHASLAAVHIARGRWAEAVASAERSVELAPSYDFAHFLLGMAYRGAGRFLAAFGAFRRGLRLDPRGQAPALAFLAELNYRAGRLDEAVASWERVRRENRDHVGSRLALAEHYERVGRLAEARTALREVLRINPDYRADRARGPGGRYLSQEDTRRLAERLRELRAEKGAPQPVSPAESEAAG